MDTTAFIEFHRLRVQRERGKEPAANTLLAKATRLRSAARITEAGDLETLATQLLDREQVNTLVCRLLAQQQPNSVRNVVFALLDFGHYARAMGWGTLAITKADAPGGSGTQKAIIVYSPEEQSLLLSAARAKGLRWWALLTTLADTGRRIGEVLSLRWEQLNLTSDPPHIHLPHTKNGRQAYVPLSERLTDKVFTRENIAELRAGLCMTPARRFRRSVVEYPFPWVYTSARDLFAAYCDTLGVPNRGFHCFRHTKATELLAKGVPLQAVSALLGHANVATTDRIYNHATALSYAEYVR